MKKNRILFLPLLIILLLATACGNRNPRVSADVDDYIGNYYETVVDEFKEAGFIDIETIAVDDLTSDGKIKDGTVEIIQINDSDSFAAGDKFSADAKVIITYHTVKKLKTPVSSDNIQEKTIEEIQETFTELGFTSVNTDEVYDLDPDTFEDEYKNEISIDGRTSFDMGEDVPFDSDILIIRHYPYKKYTVQMHINFISNFIFSKYDVKFEIDGIKQDILEHGDDADYELRLKEGEHIFTFSNTTSESVKGETTLDVTCDIESSYDIYCHSDKVNVTPNFIDYKNPLAENETKIMSSKWDFIGKDYQEVITILKELGFKNIKEVPQYDISLGITEVGSTANVTINGTDNFKRGDVFSKDCEVVVSYHLSDKDDPNRQTTEPKTETSGDNVQNDNSTFYSTNDLQTAKKGNSGVFAYRSRGGTYYRYWIIDFKEGYVYYFTDGNGESTCDRLKIDNGDLNEGILITYHAGGDTWQNALHFKWARQPDHLILEDNDHFEYDFYATDLDEALTVRDTKTITDY